MHSRSFKLLVAQSTGVIAIGFGCTGPLWTANAPPIDVETTGTTAPVPQMSRLEANGDLRLFGRDSTMNDVAFTGRAATDMQQHTLPSDGSDFDPDIGPQGKLLAYSSTRHSRNSHLYIKAITGATVTQITDGPANDAQPEFDPSGQKIAFTSDRGGHWDIWVIDVNGRNPIQITNNAMPELHPSWSPDGSSLVFCRVNSDENKSTMWVVDLANPGIKRMIGEGLFPAWSPKGDKIVYQRARLRSSRWFGIWTIDIYEDEILFPTEVASGRDTALIAPAWSPDGSQIAFCYIHKNGWDGGQAEIGLVDVDGRGQQRLTAGHGNNYSPTWSVDGRIYFSSKIADAETIWSVKPFRPTLYGEPPSATTASDRRAANASALEDMVE